MSSTKITIHLIRSLDSKSEDQKIRISKMYAGSSSVLVEVNDDKTKDRHGLILTQSSIVKYLRTLMQTLSLDKEPFEHIQFDFPGYPSFIFTIASLSKESHRRSVLSCAKIVQETWEANQACTLDNLYETRSDTSSESYMSTDSDSSSDSSSSSSSRSSQASTVELGQDQL